MSPGIPALVSVLVSVATAGQMKAESAAWSRDARLH